VIVFDASVMVSAYWDADAHHEASRSWLAAHVASDELITAPILLLSEVAGAITRRTGASEIGHAVLAQLLRVPRLMLVPVDLDIGEHAATLAADLRLHGADAIYVAAIERLEAPLMTWDHHQLERGRARVAVRRPDES